MASEKRTRSYRRAAGRRGRGVNPLYVLIPLSAVLLVSGTLLLAGCLPQPEATTSNALTPTQMTSQTTVTRTATRDIVVTATQAIAVTLTPTPTATATRVVQATPTSSATATHTPSSRPDTGKSGYQEGFTEAGEPFRGDPAAPVLFEEFSSYQCGFCGKYFQETFPQVIADYVQSGQVLYLFRDFPLPGQPQSPLAAEAANCAGKAGDGSTYWAMHDVLFAQQSEWSGRANAADIFKRYARELGGDAPAFEECLDSRATRNQAEADVAEGVARGVRGTPTFFVDGQPLVGAQPYSVISRVIDAALARGSEADSTFELAPVSALPPDIQQLSPIVQDAYRFALANPEVLEVIPCYCGCGSVGHQNNRMCYIQSETADGRVVFDRHAVT